MIFYPIYNNLMETGLNLVISEVRYITGYNKAKQSLGSHIDAVTLDTVNASIDAHINKSILSTALKLRRLIFNDSDKYFAQADAKTIIDLFNHAAKIPMFEQEKLENICSGIIRIISSFNMLSKSKKPVHIKGDPKTPVNTSAEKESEE